MGKSSGGSSGSTKATATKPYLYQDVNRAADESTDLYKINGGGYYQGSQLADTSDDTNNALNAISAQANGGAGNGLNNAAVQQYLATIRGDNLNGNPYLQQAIDASAGDVTRNFTNQILPQLQSSFATSGRYGGGLQEQAQNDAVSSTAQQIANAATQARYQNYAAERQNQITAATNAPALNQASYYDAQQLAGVGSARDSLAQARLQDKITQYQIPQQALNDYISRIAQLNGNGTLPSGSTAGAKQSVLSAGLGGAASGAAAGSAAGPWGALAGGVIGGVSGILSRK